MIKVGLTGNIASGKTAVENILKDFSIPVIDSDEINDNIFKTNFVVMDKIQQTFQTTSKKELANIVFSNPQKRKLLENILHPVILEEIDNFFEENKNSKLAVASVPLLFEAKLESKFDKVVLVHASQDIRLLRLMKRNNLTKEEALKKINSQIQSEQKLVLSDFIIQNELDFSNLKQQTLDIFLSKIC